MRRISWIALLAMCLAGGSAAIAQSQPGPFVNGTPWSIGIGTNANGTEYIINGQNYPIPSDYVGAQANLIAAGDIVRASRSAQFDCPGASVPGRTPVEVSYFRIEQSPNRLTLLRTLCVSEMIATEGYYDTGAQRIAYLVARANIASEQFIQWVDLNSGSSSTSPFGFNPSVEAVQFAPSGNLALIRHGVAGVADYDLVDLCPGVLGTDLTLGTSLDNLGAGVTGEVSNVAGGTFDVLLRQSGSVIQTVASIPDCLGATVDTGACCLPGNLCEIRTEAACLSASGTWLGVGSDCGECPTEPVGACCIQQVCSEGIPQSICEGAGGTFAGDGTTCISCPTPNLTLTVDAPASAVNGDELTYRLIYSNTGDAATGVALRAVVPSGATLVRATGDPTQTGATLDWSIGALASGASGEQSYTVRVPCVGTELTNTGASIRAGANVQAAPQVSTSLTPAATTPLAVTITAQPTNAPLMRDDLLRYDIIMTNTEPQVRTGVNFSTSFGSAVAFEQLLSNGGGAVQLNGNSSLFWRGDIGPNATVTLSFEVRVDSCATGPWTQLNFGSALFFRNGCNANLGQQPPPAPTPIAAPIASELRLLNVSVPQQFFGFFVQAIRANQIYPLQITLRNDTSTDQPLSGVAALPTGWEPVSDPPFISPTDAGASYDAASREIRWTGTVPAGGQITVTAQMRINPPGECRTFLTFDGSTPGCTNDARASIQVLLVPYPPSSPQLLQLRPFEGLQELVPSDHPVLCLAPEIYTGMGTGDNGDVWITGLPNLRINLDTLAFNILEGADLGGVTFFERVFGLSDFPFASDVAVDPRDRTAVYLGGSQGANATGALGRYDVNTDTATPIVQSPMLRGLRRLVVRSDGTIAIAGGTQGVIEVDPTDPNNMQTLSDPNTSVRVLALDPNENYLVADSFPPRLARVHATTGAYTTLADLTGWLPSGDFLTGMATDGQRVWLALQFGGGVQITLGNPPTISALPVTQTADLDLLPGMQPCSDLDSDGRVTLADLAILLADFGNQGPDATGDADGDGDTDQDDLGMVLAQFGLVC